MFGADLSTPTLNATTQAFSVSEMNTIISDVLTAGLPSHVWVEGEVSNLSSAASGHRYLSLKDSGSTISCALFRGSASRISREVLKNLKNGDKVVVKASLSVYKPRGSYQLIISDIEPAGFGALAKAFAELKTKLDNAGLTASERKRAIPTWSRGIAVVTSETGAAIRDVLTTLARRAPFIPVTVYPTLVQGSSAPEQIVNVLQQAHNNDTIDVILLVRGGGSLEDLMAFNDERVAMAVVDSIVPVVTGVGHETDFTIVDFVSDYRAPTPTAAAEIVSPDKVTLAQALERQQRRLQHVMASHIKQRQHGVNALHQRLHVQHPLRQLQQQSQRLDELTQRLQRGVSQRIKQQQIQLSHYQQQLMRSSPQQQLISSRQQLASIQQRLHFAMQQRLTYENQRLQRVQRGVTVFSNRLAAHQQQLKGLEARLTLLSPLGVLQRGYSLAFDGQGQLLRSVAEAQAGEPIILRLSDGTVSAVITDKKHKS